MEHELEQIEKELQIYTDSDQFQNNQQTVQKLSQLEDTIECLKSQLRSTTITDQRDVKLDIYGRVTKQIVDRYHQCQMKMILAPSPLEFLHDQVCDWHVFRDNQKIYKEIPECQMLRSKSVGKSQLQHNTNSSQYNMMFPIIAQIGDIITAYGSMTGFKPILPKGPNINFQQIYDLILKITPKHCIGITLDFPQCQKLLNDSGITQSIMQYNKLQIIFQRAAFLQTQLFQKTTMNSSNTLLSKVYQEKNKMKKPQYDTFHYGQVRRLGYIGIIYLFYAIAEEIDKQQDLKISYRPDQLTDPYGEYQHSPDCNDYNKMIAFVNSWKILHRFGQILDENICTQTTSCRSYGLLKPKMSLMPDLYKYPNCIQVFTRYVSLIKNIFNQIPTESQLIDYNYLYKLCAIAGIHQQLNRDFCFEVVLRLFTKVDKATFIPGLDEDEFLIAIFVCANHALYKEPFVLKLKRPEDRLEYTLEKLRLNV